MATPDRRDGGAVAGVRLTDVPLKKRRFYGRVLLDRALKEMDPIAAVAFAAELHLAVESPSARIYWISREAADKVLNGTA